MRPGRRVAGALVVALAVSSDARSAECAQSGNEHWLHFATGQFATRSVAQDPSRIYRTWVDGNNGMIAVLNKLNGAVTASRSIPSETLRSPIAFERHLGTTLLTAASSSGLVYGMDPLTAGVPTLWSRSTRRAGCSADSIVATPVVQRYDDSDAAFQTAHTADLVVVGTWAECGTAISNRVFGISAASDPDALAPGAAVFYLVSTANACGESAAGESSQGVQHFPDPSCP